MPIRRKKEIVLPKEDKEGPARIAVAAQPRMPDMERAFFDELLRALYAGMQDVEKLAKRGGDGGQLLRKCGQARGTVAYARALLRLEELAAARAADEPASLSAVLNQAEKKLRREFLYAGVAARRPDDERLSAFAVPREAALFLLEEMMACCLRCAPEGKNLHIGANRIGDVLLLVMRTEGPALQQPPLIPPLPQEGDAAGPDEDYGFSVCHAAAALLGWEFRWEADEAGVRMFLDVRL